MPPDGAMRVTETKAAPCIISNSYKPVGGKGITEPALSLRAMHHYDFREDDDDYYSQPGNLFRK